ncbi:hypothetical protein R6Q59_017724 [Mikania micrantha]
MFKEVRLEEIQHEHPLTLEDLQSIYQGYEEDDDDFDDLDLIAMQNFKGICDICGRGIDWYHRYYYKCSRWSSCSYSIHKFCGERLTTFQFPAHPIHTLHLNKTSHSWKCHSCHTIHRDGICYHCSTCNYEIDLPCVTFAEQTIIHHPGHPHQLISLAINPTLCKCYPCGKEHKGVFYHCITCFKFSVHVDCVTLPFKLTLEHHVHMLTLSYSSSGMPLNSICRICGMNMSRSIWLYKCSKCRYYAHLDCATSTGGAFMCIFSRGIGRTYTNFKAIDYPNVTHYPLLDESYNMLPHQVLRGNYRDFEKIKFDKGSYIHSSHNHPLLLIDNAPDSKSIIENQPTSLHNPMKRIKLVCDGCLRPITKMPYFVCINQVVSGCNFYLHEWCTRLPCKLKNHPGHPKHPLVLFYFTPGFKCNTRFNVTTRFVCNACGLDCNGFGYVCSICNYVVDVHCGFIPKRIMHEAHPSHLLSRVDALSIQSNNTIEVCNACDSVCTTTKIYFKCSYCAFYLHNPCALHLPKTIRNKCDRHPLKLSYSPIENHKSEYFCEVCEGILEPEKWFYHCQECGQSIHTTCAPLILQSEQDNNDYLSNQHGVYKFLNMKFGGLLVIEGHQHHFSFLAGTKSDSWCFVCRVDMQSKLIFKCITCKIAFHIRCVIEGLDTWSSILDKSEVRSEWRSIGFRYPLKFRPPPRFFDEKEVVRPVTQHHKLVGEAE